MILQKKFSRQIEKKHKEIEELKCKIREIELSIREAEAYIQAFEDMMKHLPKTGDDEERFTVRVGSAIDLARKVLEQSGVPLHVDDLLIKMGREAGKSGRQALSGQLSHYVRQNRIFTRTAPNTFGLKQWLGESDDMDNEQDDQDSNPDIPGDFGKLRTIDIG